MALSPNLEAFFEKMEAEDGIVVTNHPKFDLDLYMQNYTGRTRYDRLIHIGKCCVPLCVEALKLAVREAKQGNDVWRYKEAWDCLAMASPTEPEAVYDGTWVTQKEDMNAQETARLELELKGYKNNLVKESIRMGNEDLGHHFEDIGDLKEALESYTRMRHDVSTTKHIVDCAQRLVGVCLQRRDWPAVISNVSKLNGLSTSNTGSDYEGSMQPYTKVVHGLGQMGLKKYEEAAQSFVQTESDFPTGLFEDLVSPNDVAMYGALLSLATMNRDELQTNVLENSNFRTYLEYEPQIRKAISLFVTGRYATCLSILNSYKADFLLDIYLSKHVETIFNQIRSKCIVHFCIPFSCVTLQSLNEAFAKEGETVEADLVAMIRDGTLKAKINSKDQVLIAERVDPRWEMQQKALDVAQRYEQEAKERLRRVNLISAGLEVTNPKNKNLNSLDGLLFSSQGRPEAAASSS